MQYSGFRLQEGSCSMILKSLRNKVKQRSKINVLRLVVILTQKDFSFDKKWYAAELCHFIPLIFQQP